MKNASDHDITPPEIDTMHVLLETVMTIGKYPSVTILIRSFFCEKEDHVHLYLQYYHFRKKNTS
jgi:hypothetical protein